MRLSAILRRLVAQPVLVAASVVILGGAGSFWTYRQLQAAESLRTHDAFLQEVAVREIELKQTVASHFGALQPLSAAFSLQPRTTLDTFKALAADTVRSHPEFVRLEWVPLVKASQRQAFEETQRTAQADYRLQPATDTQSDAYPIGFVQGPSSARAELGRDLKSAEFADVLEAARARRRASVTGVHLASLSGQAERVLTVVSPVFARTADGSGPATPDGFVGFVLGTVRTADVLGRGPRMMSAGDLLIVDATPGAGTADRLIAWRPGDLAAPKVSEAEFRAGWYREVPVSVGERLWLLLHRQNATWLESRGSVLPLLSLVGGLTLSLLGGSYVFWSFRAQKEAANASDRDPRNGEKLPDASAAAQLRRSQQLLNALMENNPSGIFVKDVQGRYLAVNRQFAEMYGRNREEFAGRSDLDLFAPEVASRLRLSDTRVLSSGKPIELEESFSLPAGNHTSIIHKFPLIGEDGRVHGLCGITTDISERKRAEAEIRESRRQLESLLGQLPGMAFRLINDGQMTPVYVSRGALGLTGHGARDFIEGVVRLPDVIHPEDRERSRTSVAAAVKKRRGFEVEYRIIDRAGRIKWVLERGQGVFDEDGKLLFIEGLAIDITQRKDAEAEKLLVERRLLEGQKLESIGVLAGGIAHDFNNLLTGIIGNANLAALDLPTSSRVQGNLKQIEVASQRAAELCQQMLAYAGKGRFVMQRIEFGHLVETTVPLLKASISKRARLKFDLTPGIPAILADPTQMRQIVMNLVLNASEALGDQDGEIAISTRLMRPTSDYLTGAVLAPPELGSDFVVLEVKDSGCGMTPETIAKIFDPFFTTKFAGRGLGLAAVLGIIRSHKGALKVTSKPGLGSTFTLLFPVLAGPTEVGIVRKNTAAPWRQEGLVLIIDDEDHVRNVTAGMLNTCGLRTETARDGYEGLDLFRAKPQSFDLVLLDMTMPRLSGEETLLLLREIRPDVRVLFMSGYNRREVIESLAGEGVLSFIQKPFTLEALREHLQQILA